LGHLLPEYERRFTRGFREKRVIPKNPRILEMAGHGQLFGGKTCMFQAAIGVSSASDDALRRGMVEYASGMCEVVRILIKKRSIFILESEIESTSFLGKFQENSENGTHRILRSCSARFERAKRGVNRPSIAEMRAVDTRVFLRRLGTRRGPRRADDPPPTSNSACGTLARLRFAFTLHLAASLRV